MSLRLRHLAAGVAAVMPLAGAGQAIAAGTITITSISAGPSLGLIWAGTSATTTFTMAAGSGAVSTAGPGRRQLSTNLPVTVNYSCTGSGTCASRSGTITAGTIGGRASALTKFTVGSSATYTTAASPLTFTLPGLNNGSTGSFTVGMDFPIQGDNASTSTTATAAFTVALASTTSGTASATVARGVSVSSMSNLQFGAIVPPTSGTGTVSLDATSGAVSVTGTGAGVRPGALYPHARGLATFTGEGASLVSLSAPSFNMVSGTNTFVVSTTLSQSNPATLSGVGGSLGSLVVGVGGSFTLSSGSPVGTYTGTFTVSATYN